MVKYLQMNHKCPDAGLPPAGTLRTQEVRSVARTIPLSRGRVTIVDDADYEWLVQWKWFWDKGYACRADVSGGRRRNLRMHRALLGVPDGVFVDHINGDKLDNRRENLRRATKLENRRNSTGFVGTSKYKGVHWASGIRRWCASIAVGPKTHWLGQYSSEDQAALAYDEAARRLFGEFARLNFPGVSDYSKRTAPVPSSEYRGVWWHKTTGKWRVQIRVEGRRIHLGEYDNEVDAALAYDAAALHYRGKAATLNFAAHPAPSEAAQEIEEGKS